MKLKTNICVICKKEFKGLGHNAQPLKDGRCCDNCNSKVLIQRLINYYEIDVRGFK